VIKSAQELAASAFGAKHTWFLVNGCSAGIHAAVMATVRPGEALLLARNCHLSAFSACVLSDAVPVWLQPEQDPLHGIAHCIPPHQLKHGFQVAKQRGLKVAAVLVVSPTYYGVLARVSGEVADQAPLRVVHVLSLINAEVLQSRIWLSPVMSARASNARFVRESARVLPTRFDAVTAVQ